MTPDQLEQRLLHLEATLQGLQRAMDALRSGRPYSNGVVVDASTREVSPEQAEADAQWEREWEPYRKYLRQTGRMPPDSWKPGDPIPEPDGWT